MDNCGCLNSTCVISILLRIYEKKYSVRTLTDEPSPFPHTNQYAFSWATPSPSERTYFMDDPAY